MILIHDFLLCWISTRATMYHMKYSLVSFAAQNVVSGLAVRESPGSLLEMQNLGPPY